MDILIIGGTKFLGKALSQTILDRGNNLTMFNRGKTNPDFMPEADKIQGDREMDIANLGDRKWDVVIDTCGYVPRIVSLSANYLKDKVKNYVFISSISAYKSTEEFNADETIALIELEGEERENEEVMKSAESYGGLKVMCENVVIDTFGDNATIIRPGLIVGPNDPTNRFTYWPVRLRKGGKTLTPGDGSFPMQIMDVRDLAEFTIHLAEKDTKGIYNATGPNTPFKLKEMLEEINNVLGNKAELQWADEKFLEENKVGPWMEMPCWIPSTEGAAMMHVSVEKAVTNGMKYRSLETIVKDTLEWYDNTGADSKEWPAGMKEEKEKDLLEKLLLWPVE